ncbi:hypothetical protein FB45DRAFT_981796 [Roridomyces roridus]|uniref:Integrase core domain-containing protein n=1 Tax=Roridomyces roridus TaxID=1738132 RepID=A0AAD7B8U7_9AGAR|nr:hypothetical protein FB45DRAFT_981796 [Roridomyces roridus]
MHADKMIRDAQFVVDSLPNVEPFAVERALRQLSAIHYLFANLNDAWLDQDDINQFISVNIRMERGWRDVRKDTLELYRQIFAYLEQSGLLDMESAVHRVCLYIIFQPRIQHSLDETRSSWNNHKIRTAGNKTPIALYQLSKTRAINRGYWTGDPGDDIRTASDPAYGEDPGERLPPADELANDPTSPDFSEFPNVAAERDAGIFVNEDEEIREAEEALGDLGIMEDDGNWGIDIYCRAVLIFTAHLEESEDEN